MGLTLFLGHEWATKIQGLAVAVLEAAASNDEAAAELAVEFAEVVIASLEPVNRLAIAVLDGGPLTMRRTVELAGLLVGTVDTADEQQRPFVDAAERG